MSGAERHAPLVELRGVTRVYGSGEAAVEALRGIDLEIGAGDFIAMMGPSGSGKSTCMNILGCLDKPSAGQHRFQGVDVGVLTADERALVRRSAIGFVFQGFNLLARTSALENVELPLVYRGVRSAPRRARALAALAAVGLADRARHAPNELSGGQQQRVAIARAIAAEPSVLFADEPTGNLDTARSHELMQLLAGLNAERGLTIVMVTHEADMAEYARRTVLFRDGLIEREATT
ncbi:MAG: ABC transporter ATP-binding protein [Gammaproteobacteria bacterium]